MPTRRSKGDDVPFAGFLNTVPKYVASRPAAVIRGVVRAATHGLCDQVHVVVLE